MVAVGNALGLTVVAEGVETIEQAQRLQSVGCPSAQGYLFARTQTANALRTQLTRLAVLMS
jgi:EAL domain-containing protein (putative c-di-GMP-specific phosphodiesterase class I)